MREGRQRGFGQRKEREALAKKATRKTEKAGELSEKGAGKKQRKPRLQSGVWKRNFGQRQMNQRKKVSAK